MADDISKKISKIEPILDDHQIQIDKLKSQKIGRHVAYSSERFYELVDRNDYPTSDNRVDDIIFKNVISEHSLEVTGTYTSSNAMYGIDNGDGTYTHYAKMYLIDLFPIVPAGSFSNDGISFGVTFVGHEVLDYVDDQGNVHKKNSGKRGLWTIVRSGYCAEVIVKIISPFKCVACMTNGTWTDDTYESPAYTRMDTTITEDDSLTYYNTYSISSYAWSDDALREVETYTTYEDWEPKDEYASGKCFGFMGLELVDDKIIAHRMPFANGTVRVISTGTGGTYSVDLLADSDGYYGTVKDILSGGETYKIKATDGIYCAGDRPDNNGSFTFETIADIWSYEYTSTYVRGMRKYNAGHTFPSSTNYNNKMCLSAMEPVQKHGSSSTLSRRKIERLRSHLSSDEPSYVPMFYCNYTSETYNNDNFTFVVEGYEGYEDEYEALYNYVAETGIHTYTETNDINDGFAHVMVSGSHNDISPSLNSNPTVDVIGNMNSLTNLQNSTIVIGSKNAVNDTDITVRDDTILIGNDNGHMIRNGYISGIFIGNGGNGLFIKNVTEQSAVNVHVYKEYNDLGPIISDYNYSVYLQGTSENLILYKMLDNEITAISTIPWSTAADIFYTQDVVDGLLAVINNKLDTIETGAQVNTIESISVNGVEQEIIDKNVNIILDLEPADDITEQEYCDIFNYTQAYQNAEEVRF